LPRCPARSGAIRLIAASTKPLTAAKRGTKFSKPQIFRLVAPMWRSIPRIQISCLQRCGISGAKAGSTVQVAQVLRRLRPADCFALRTPGTPGRRLRRKSTRVFRRNHTGALQWQSHLRTTNVFMRLSNHPKARSLSQTMAARLGRSATKANGWCGDRSISRT
jgi:hypothetical protein